MHDLQIDLTREDAVALVGRLDGRTAAVTRAVLQDLVDGVPVAKPGDTDRPGQAGQSIQSASTSARVVVDLGGLEIWDRVGLGVIVGLARRASGRGVLLVLTNAGAREQRLLRVAGVARMARITTGVPQQNRGPYGAESLLGA